MPATQFSAISVVMLYVSVAFFCDFEWKFLFPGELNSHCLLSSCPWRRHAMGTLSTLLVVSEGPTGHRWIPFTKGQWLRLMIFLCCLPEQSVEQTVESPVVWNAIMLFHERQNVSNHGEFDMWRHCYVIYVLRSEWWRMATRSIWVSISMNTTLPRSSLRPFRTWTGRTSRPTRRGPWNLQPIQCSQRKTVTDPRSLTSVSVAYDYVMTWKRFTNASEYSLWWNHAMITLS